MCRFLARHALALCLAFGWLTGCAASPDPTGAQVQACRPQKRAELPLRQLRNFLLVPATLDGHAATMLVDTGSEITTLTPTAAAALRLPRDPAHRRALAGITSDVRSASLLLHRLMLGGSVVAAPLSVGVGALPSLDGVDPPVAGLLGADVLARFDVELDLPAGRMALYTPSPCAGYAPWADAVSVPLRDTRSRLALLDAEVDGHVVRALLDTGARTSLMALQTALTLGITPAMLAADIAAPGIGVGSAVVTFRQHRFASFGVPGAIAHNVPLDVANLPLPGVEMLLGVDYLGHRHLWISYAMSRLFLR